MNYNRITKANGKHVNCGQTSQLSVNLPSRFLRCQESTPYSNSLKRKEMEERGKEGNKRRGWMEEERKNTKNKNNTCLSSHI